MTVRFDPTQEALPEPTNVWERQMAERYQRDMEAIRDAFVCTADELEGDALQRWPCVALWLTTPLPAPTGIVVGGGGAVVDLPVWSITYSFGIRASVTPDSRYVRVRQPGSFGQTVIVAGWSAISLIETAGAGNVVWTIDVVQGTGLGTASEVVFLSTQFQQINPSTGVPFAVSDVSITPASGGGFSSPSGVVTETEIALRVSHSTVGARTIDVDRVAVGLMVLNTQ